MSEKGLGEAALLDGLRGIHLPPEDEWGWMADILASVALAGLAAILLGLLLRLFSKRTERVREPSLAEKLDGLTGLPDDEVRVGLLHLLREYAPERYEAVKGKLYRKEGNLALETLRQEVRNAV